MSGGKTENIVTLERAGEGNLLQLKRDKNFPQLQRCEN